MTYVKRLSALLGSGERICVWDDKKFRRRTTGGKEQLYCSVDCKREFEAALKLWAREQFNNKRVTVEHLLSASRSTNIRLSLREARNGTGKSQEGSEKTLELGLPDLFANTLYGPPFNSEAKNNDS